MIISQYLRDSSLLCSKQQNQLESHICQFCFRFMVRSSYFYVYINSSVHGALTIYDVSLQSTIFKTRYTFFRLQLKYLIILVELCLLKLIDVQDSVHVVHYFQLSNCYKRGNDVKTLFSDLK